MRKVAKVDVVKILIQQFNEGRFKIIKRIYRTPYLGSTSATSAAAGDVCCKYVCLLMSLKCLHVYNIYFYVLLPYYHYVDIC